MMYRLYWQDFRGRRVGMGDPPPKRQFSDHATREEAEEARKLLPRDPDLVVSIGLSPMGRAERARSVGALV